MTGGPLEQLALEQLARADQRKRALADQHKRDLADQQKRDERDELLSLLILAIHRLGGSMRVHDYLVKGGEDKRWRLVSHHDVENHCTVYRVEEIDQETEEVKAARQVLEDAGYTVEKP